VSERSNFLGITLGVIITTSFIGWFGYQHYENTEEDRLPLKVKQGLVNFQKQLPMKLSEDVILEYFQLQKNSIDLVLRSARNLEGKIPKNEIISRMNFFVCKWRDKFLQKKPITLNFKLLNSKGNNLASIKNTPQTCMNTPKVIPKKFQS
tara:strand:- start:277 stop:726 length:450 start_codon:yes stop_codon:yes gene_type:complete